MKINYSVILFCCLSINIYCQCPENGSLFFKSQEELDDFGEQYPDCTEINGIVTIRETDVSDLSPLSNIERINGFFNILDNDNLKSLHGLEKLTTTGTLSIRGVDSIKNFFSLSNLENITGLRITECPDLESLDGLEKVRDCSGFLEIADNPKLKNIEAIKNITKVQGFWIINNNSLERLPNFYNLDKFFGQSTSSNLIWDNDNLLSLKGLDSIRTFGRFEIKRNPRLKSLDGLQGLKKMTLPIDFIDISDNDSLVTLSGLEGLDSLFAISPEIFGNIYVRNNALLENVDALTNLVYVEGDLIIENNAKLSNINGLSGLSNVERNVVIGNNANLSSLSGLDSLDYTSFNSLTISNCENLSFCSVKSVCQALTNNANVTIELNDEGCNDDQEVSEICLTSNEEIEAPKLDFHPNPIVDYLYIDSKLSIPIESIKIYNHLGALISVTINDFSIDFKDQPSGVYFMTVLNNGTRSTYKLLKI